MAGSKLSYRHRIRHMDVLDLGIRHMDVLDPDPEDPSADWIHRNNNNKPIPVCGELCEAPEDPQRKL